MIMRKNPRDYPDTMLSAESGRPMTRGEKPVTLEVDKKTFKYLQPGWWCSLADDDDMDGQLVDEDNKVAEMALRTAKALAKGETLFVPVVIRAIRENCGLTQREAGRLFGGGEKSFEKYESGEITPSDPTKRLLKLAMEHPEFFRKPPPGSALPSAQEGELIRKALNEAALDRIYAPLFAAVN
jgi:HTH-type transcriptional regulator / antitoxin MqsA